MSLRTSRNLKEFNEQFEAAEKLKKYEAEAPLREAAEKLSRTHASVISAENALACQELMNRSDNPALAKRVKAFDPLN